MFGLSLVGAIVALIGLLVLAVASGVRRGSALSRLLLTIYLVVLAALNTLLAVLADDWDWSAILTAVISVAIVVVLWTPPVSRTFGRIRESSMGAQPRQDSRA